VSYRIESEPFEIEPGSAFVQAANVLKKPMAGWRAREFFN
jgi:hypothetical protein